jgi:penicillin-binding protein 1C
MVMKFHFLRLFSFSILILVLGGLAIWLWIFKDLPAVDGLSTRAHIPSVRIVDRNNRLLYEALQDDNGRHAAITLGAIPLACQQATIATEDRRFYSHPGVDFVGILRAAWINLRRGETLAGGSTITQQVARNLLMDAQERGERSLRRKLREAALAWQITRRFSKDYILNLYLNQSYYGGMAYGIEAAAQTFFGKSVRQLDAAECAMLAGLPQAPALYNPFTDPEAAKERQRIVLRLMQEDGYLTAEQRLLAEREPLVFAETPYPMEAPHFVMMARAELDRLLPPEQRHLYSGLVVRTTLDLNWQKLGEAAVARHLEELQRSNDGLGHRVNNAALVALDAHSGEVLALIGSPDYFDGQHGGAINMALAPRQPGSAIKPLVYAAALDPRSPGGGWTAATLLLDVSTAFMTHKGEAYIPANYDLRQHGPVLVREALASSLNIPAVLTLEHVGLTNFFALAKKLGINTFGNPQKYDLSLALGGGEVRLLELTAAYAALANQGYRIDPQIILEVRDLNGNLIYRPPAQTQMRVLDERVAWLISDILSDNEARRLGFGAHSILRLDRPAAVKTGTTSNFHDNWTIGYTPDLVVGVWSGNTNYEPMRGVNGLSGAAPIWHQFMRSALANQPAKAFVRPPGMIQVEICALSGRLPTPDCPYRRLEWFIEGTQPTQFDTFYREVVIDVNTGRLATAETPPERWLRRTALDLPPQAQPWARAQGLTLYADLLPLEEINASAEVTSLAYQSPTEALRLVSPAAGSLFRLSSSISRDAQRIQLEAVGAPNLQSVTLWVDGVMTARLDRAPYRTWWTLRPGAHRAWAEAVLANGQHLSSPVIYFSVVQE